MSLSLEAKGNLRKATSRPQLAFFRPKDIQRRLNDTLEIVGSLMDKMKDRKPRGKKEKPLAQSPDYGAVHRDVPSYGFGWADNNASLEAQELRRLRSKRPLADY